MFCQIAGPDPDTPHRQRRCAPAGDPDPEAGEQRPAVAARTETDSGGFALSLSRRDSQFAPFGRLALLVGFAGYQACGFA